MKKVTIAATVPKDEKENKPEMTAQLTVDYAETLEEAKQMYGEEALLTNAFANWRITLQSNIRASLKRGETQEQIQTRLGASKMGVASAGVKIDPVQAYIARFASATPEEQAKMLQDLQQAAAK